ncbi:protein-disulfide reductase DsbD [Caviibacterium pharyngocola]|uniref:Thiol:disulfide interchange protein DsbD n=1 Tax=Caviibacterium pharyngocola TaxID=28159 RepID=A0A2M8RT26_9PAST|nr:protein-disulfide reductase DsbD [Caviibacterium pharyngocola]PJG82019.1 protein-disulfide reductase DsbD [Caviibacterium pharyngocola]
MKKFFFFYLFLFTAFGANADLFGNKTKFLTADKAFRLNATQQANGVELSWEIAPEYYLYKKEILLENEQGKIDSVALPEAETYQDEFFGETEIYRDKLALSVPAVKLANSAVLSVTYQGCTKGFCYPPETKTIQLAALDQPSNATQDIFSEKITALSSNNGGQDSFAARLFESKYAALGFFLLGLGLAFTPCVLPMLPLLSAIVIGANQRPNTLYAFGLSFVYVQGMALTYTLLGLIVALIGLPFQVALQSPVVLIGLSVIFILLALSMFGVFTLQLPASWQTKLTQLSQTQKSGAFGGVFVMGMIAGLVASPCTSAPLSGALLYVAQSGDIWTGALTLYLLALGMGLPLIAVTLFGNKILPKSGEWMINVKIAFGFVMLALPVFLLSRVLPEEWENRLWALLGAAFFLWAAWQMHANGIGKALRILLLIAAMIAVKPLQTWFWGTEPRGESAVPSAAISSSVRFQRVNDYAQLQQLLKTNPNAVAMLDLYADWCVACKEFEKYTFSDPTVRRQFEKILLLQVDMTKNSPANTELIEKLKVIGLPTIIFFDQQGAEIQSARISGFMSAQEFSDWLSKRVIP